MSRFLPDGRHRAVILVLAAVGAVLVAAGFLIRDAPTVPTDSASSYETSLEERIEDLCRSVDGIDTAKALITLERNDGSVYSASSAASSAVGDLPVRGVAVVVSGGDRPETQALLTELISSCLGIPTNRIAVAPAKSASRE